MSAPSEQIAGEAEVSDAELVDTSPGDSAATSPDRSEAVFIAALDVGTTCVRCFVLDERCAVRGSAVDAVSVWVINLTARGQSEGRKHNQTIRFY